VEEGVREVAALPKNLAAVTHRKIPDTADVSEVSRRGHKNWEFVSVSKENENEWGEARACKNANVSWKDVEWKCGKIHLEGVEGRGKRIIQGA